MKRIRILTLAVGTCLVSAAFAQQPANTSHWSEFHEQNMMRWNQYETVLGVNNVAGLKVKWGLLQGITPVYNSPIEANGMVYINVGSPFFELYALDGGDYRRVATYGVSDTFPIPGFPWH